MPGRRRNYAIELERRRLSSLHTVKRSKIAKNLKTMAGGINLEEGDIGITPKPAWKSFSSV